VSFVSVAYWPLARTAARRRCVGIAIMALNVAVLAPLKHENYEIYSWLAIKFG
jgi:hypothetical protein